MSVESLIAVTMRYNSGNCRSQFRTCSNKSQTHAMKTHLHPRRLSFLILASLAALIGGRQTFAGDWPQILGPHRNCIADDEKLAASWPGGKPGVVWKMDV